MRYEGVMRERGFHREAVAAMSGWDGDDVLIIIVSNSLPIA